MREVLHTHLPGQAPCWTTPLQPVFSGSPYFIYSVVGTTAYVRLDIASLVSDVPRPVSAQQRPRPRAVADNVSSGHIPQGAAALQSLQLLPVPGSLAALQSVTKQQCAAAEVEVVPETWCADSVSDGFDPLLQLELHLEGVRLCALDLEFAQATAEQTKQYSQAQSQGQHEKIANPAAASNSHAPRVDVLALMQLFVPACEDLGFAATIYIVEVSQQQAEAAAALGCLQPLLQDPGVVKVMHDARCDSSVLLQQFGIQLAGVLDTQVLAGMATLAAAVPNASSSSSSGRLDGASSSQAAASSAVAGSGSGSGLSDINRVGLGKLYEAYGCPHPRKHTVGKSFDENPR